MVSKKKGSEWEIFSVFQKSPCSRGWHFSAARTFGVGLTAFTGILFQEPFFKICDQIIYCALTHQYGVTEKRIQQMDL